MAKICKKVALLVLFFGFMPHGTNAATFSLSPQTNAYHVGDTFTIGVYAEGIDRAINAASGVISFPASRLEVVALSKNGSILTLWVTEPSFSNNIGMVQFEGIVPNPGFVGASGKLLTVTFKVKTPGTGSITFSSGSLLANDGQGTNILTRLGTTYVILSDISKPVLAKPPPVLAVASPSLVSTTTKNTASSSRIALSETRAAPSDDEYVVNIPSVSATTVVASVSEPAYLRIAENITTILSVFVPLIALILLCLFLLSHGWHKLLKHHRRLRKRVCEMDIEKSDRPIR